MRGKRPKDHVMFLDARTPPTPNGFDHGSGSGRSPRLPQVGHQMNEAENVARLGEPAHRLAPHLQEQADPPLGRVVCRLRVRPNPAPGLQQVEREHAEMVRGTPGFAGRRWVRVEVPAVNRLDALGSIVRPVRWTFCNTPNATTAAVR